MKNEKITYKILTAIGFAGAAACYFFPFVRVNLGKYDDLLKDAFEILFDKEYGKFLDFSPFNVLKILFELKKDFSEVNGYIVLAFVLLVIPFILAVASAFTVFFTNYKKSGMILCCTGAYGMISNIVLRILLATTEVDVYFTKLSLKDYFSFDVASYVNLVLFAAGILMAVAMLIMSSSEDENQPDSIKNYNSTDYSYGNDYNYDLKNDYGNEYDYSSHDEITVATNPIDYDQPHPQGYAEASDMTVKLKPMKNSYLVGAENVVGHLHCKSGKYKGGVFPLCAGETLAIGRDSRQCNIVIGEDSVYVSRKHCEISFDQRRGQYLVKSDSINSVKVKNGKKIEKGQSQYLDKGTVIFLGNEENAFSLE